VVNPNRTNTTLVHAVDLFATLLELAGTSVSAVVPAGVAIDSQSIGPALQGATDSARRVYVDLFGVNLLTGQDGRCLRDARYKLIQLNSGTEGFYDLQNDPYEGTNLLSGALSAEQKLYYDRLQFWLYGYTTNAGPRISATSWAAEQFSCTLTQAADYALWRCDDLASSFWSRVTNASATTNGAAITLTDVAPPVTRAFYSVVK